MKKVCVVLVLLLALSVLPVVAENTHQESMTLQAMSHLSSVVPMTDQQLATVAGDGLFFIFKLTYTSNQRFMFQAYCGGFAAFHCNDVGGVSHAPGDISPRQNEGAHPQKDISPQQDKGSHPQVEGSVSCTARDCSRRTGVDVVVDTHGGIHIEQITQGRRNSNNVAIVQQSNGQQTATVRQINRAAP